MASSMDFEDFATAASSGIHFKEANFIPFGPFSSLMWEDHHVTLLYLGGGKDEEVAKRNGRLAGPEAVAQLREEFQRRQGEVMQLEVSSILWEEGRACCAGALLKERTLCAPPGARFLRFSGLSPSISLGPS